MQSLMQVQHYILLQIDSSKFKHVYSRAPALLKRAPTMQWHISILSNGCQAPVLFSKMQFLLLKKKPCYSNKHEYIFHSVTYWCFWSWQVNFGNWPAEAIMRPCIVNDLFFLQLKNFGFNQIMVEINAISKMATTKQYILHNLESQIRDSIWNVLSKLLSIII